MSERTFLRIGAVLAVVGAIVTIVLLFLVPVTIGDPIDRPEESFQKIADSAFWLPWHVVLLLSLLSVFGGLGAISRSITGEPGATWSRLALIAALLGTAFMMVLMGSEGIGLTLAAEAWVDAPAAEKAAALHAARAVGAVNLGIFSLWTAAFFGASPFFYGLAISTSGAYPRWLGWFAVVLGLGGVATSVVAFLTRGRAEFQILFVLLVLLWGLVMGILLWRKSAAAA